MVRGVSVFLIFLTVSSIHCTTPKKSIGVIGAGAGGLSAAWALAYAGYNVTIYEAYSVVGGHAFTYDFVWDGTKIPVDLGAQFIAPRRYPNTAALFQTYNIRLNPWPWNFESSLFGEKWSTTNNEWNQTAFWQSMQVQARIFEDSMEKAYREPMTTSVLSWCNQLGLGVGFQTKVLTPMMLFIMQSLLSPVHEVASFFVMGLNSFFGDCSGWFRPGDGVGRTWETITASVNRQLPNFKVYTNAFVTSVGLCKDTPLSCRVNVNINGKAQTFNHDYLVSGLNRPQLFEVLKSSTNPNGDPLKLDSAFQPMLNILKSELTSAIPTFLHSDINVMDPISPKRATMYQYFSTLYTHNYLQQDITRLGYKGAPLVSYKPLNGLGWSPNATKVQMRRDFSTPIMSTDWIMKGQYMSRTFNGMGNLWFCGGMVNGDYQESAVITGLLVANSLGADYPFPNNTDAFVRYKVWASLLQGKKLSVDQVQANGVIKNWIKRVKPLTP